MQETYWSLTARMQRSVCTPLCAGTPVPAGGGSWSHLSLCLFCLGCDRRAAAQEDKSGRNVVGTIVLF